MKKLLVVLLALTCLSALAFADASIGFGFGRTQFSVAASSSAAGATITQGWSNDSVAPDSWPPAPRENLDIAYSSDHAAFHFTGYLDGTVLTWPGIYGTLKLMPDLFSLMIGRFDNDGWDTFRMSSPHPIRDVNNNNVGRFNGWGVILDIAPKDSGFDAAVMYRTGDPTVGSSIDAFSNTVLNTYVAASYTLPNLLKITAGSTTEGALYFPNRNFFGRVQLLLIPNLTLWADARYFGFDVTPTATSNIVAELAGSLNLNPLTIVWAVTYSALETVPGTKTSVWAAYPEVYFNMGAITLGLFAGIMGGDLPAVPSGTIGWQVEPYIVLNDFNLRASFHYISSTESGAVSRWEVPVLITWGF